MAKQKKIRIVTPQGIAKFPYLNSPDTKFNADGEYRVGILLDPSDEDVQEFLEKLDKMAEEAVEKAKDDLIENKKKRSAEKVVPNEPYREDVDSEGEPTGKIEVRFKMKAKVTKKNGDVITLEPRLFDAKGKPFPKDKMIYGGALLKINFTPNPYYVAGTKAAGISLQMNAVQVLELSSGADAGFFGFGEEEGFSAEEDSFDEGSNDGDAGPTEEDDF